MPIEIPATVAEAGESGKIPQAVAELPTDSEAPEVHPYLISFARYNERMCELSILGNNKGKRIVESLKKIGTKVRCSADFQRENIDRIPVRCEGDYKRLFNGLESDIELKELKLQEKARLFYFDIEPKRTLYVVAITENHLETGKVRR